MLKDTCEQKAWHAFLDDPLRMQALEVARLVAVRMRDPEYVTSVAKQVSHQTLKPNLEWHAPSLTFGFASIALFYACYARCFPGEEWETIARRYLLLAAEGTRQSPLQTASFFYGTSGLAALVSLLNNNEQPYHHTVQHLHKHICNQIHRKPWWRKGTGGVALEDYDVIGGASGILAYLLTIAHPDEDIISSIETLVAYLCRLAGTDVQTMHERWYVSPALFVMEWQRQAYPQGYVNCGMAHGIAGPLAALAKTWRMGYRISGLREATVTLSRWLVEHAVNDEWGMNWPAVFPVQALQASTEWKTHQLARASWCSGAAGISRALWLAGTALEDASLCQLAMNAIESVLQRPAPVRNIDAPTLCHGVGGLLMICLRFAHETDNEHLREHSVLLVEQILAAFNPDYPFGFFDLESANNGSEGKVRVDHPGWLEGAAGTALILLAAATSIPPDWDRYLLIT